MDIEQTDDETKVYLPLGTTKDSRVELVSVKSDERSLKRVDTYKSTGEQLDMIYHDILDGKLDKTGTFYKYVLSVKELHA